jgi:hypothetical protein
LSKVLTGQVKALTGQSQFEATIGNGLMGLVALFLVMAGIILLADGIKALNRHRQPPVVGLPAEAK